MKLLKHNWTNLLAGLALSLSFVGATLECAQAQVNVSGIIREITPGQRPIENVDVSNFSDKRILQVDISARQVFFDTEGNETAETTDDFLIAPKTMILRPGEKKQARLVLREPLGEKERYYRIGFKARLPEPIRMKALELTEAEQAKQDELKAGVFMVSGVGMFITVAPENPKPKLTWARKPDGNITFRNEGNTTIEMRARKNYCYEGNTCVDLPNKRIFPGHTWQFDFPADEPLVYYYKIYDKTKKAVIGAVD